MIAEPDKSWRTSISKWRSSFIRREDKALWSGAALVLVGLTVGLMIWRADRDPDRILAVASLNDSTVQISNVSCLSIDPHKVVFDQKDYSDPKLVELISNKLQIEKVMVNADFAICPWSLFVTVVPGTVFAVHRDGAFAKYLVSVGICGRTARGSINPDNCLSKNIYVFHARVEPYQLLSMGLVGLKMPQSSEWEPFEIRGRDE